MEPLDVFVAMGSNLGDRQAHLAFAVARLERQPNVGAVVVSRIYETAPVGPPGQGPYLNAVLQMATRMAPREALDLLLAIEAQAGRSRENQARWGPRCLDLDLLLYGDQVVQEPGLTVPHPRLHERGFVLEPLCELAGGLRHPVLGRSFESLAQQVRDPVAVHLWKNGGSGLARVP